jgi:hypothetical protein
MRLAHRMIEYGFREQRALIVDDREPRIDDVEVLGARKGREQSGQHNHRRGDDSATRKPRARHRLGMAP